MAHDLHPERTFMRVLAFSALLQTHGVAGQGTCDHVPGKMYVIAISAASVEPIAPGSPVHARILDRLSSAYGLLENAANHIHCVVQLSDRKWILVYFDPGRQTETELQQDHYLLNWALHGHDVQILPLELMASPAQLTDLGSSTTDRR